MKQKKLLNTFNSKNYKKPGKKLCSQIIYEKTKMRALCSKMKKRNISVISLGEVLKKGHFRNVQKPFSAIRSDLIFSY